MSEVPRCPWCRQPEHPLDVRQDVADQIATELEAQAGAWENRPDLDGSQWFAEGIRFAAMWLRNLDH